MPGDAACERSPVPVCWTVDDPIGLECRCGRRGVAEVQGCVALHVAESILACAGVDAWNFVVDGQIKTVAERTKAIRVGVDLILQEVAQEREGAAVCSFGVGRHVDGGDDESAGVVAAHSKHSVLDVLR